jgi:hypothetical protein
MSTLILDQIQSLDGRAILNNTGSILQVITATKDNTSSTTSTDYVDIGGLGISIIPYSLSSKILIFFNINVGQSENSTVFFKLVRNSTDILFGKTISSSNSETSNINYGSTTAFSQNYLDSPNSIYSTTYKIQWATENSSLAFINRTSSIGQNTEIPLISTITLMEVSA